MVVHDVEVDPVGPGGDDRADLLPQLGEIGGKDTGSDEMHGGGLVGVGVTER